MMAGDRVSAKLGVAVKANAQNATADAVVIWRIVFIGRSNQFEALGVFRTSRPSLIWSPRHAFIGARDVHRVAAAGDRYRVVVGNRCRVGKIEREEALQS